MCRLDTLEHMLGSAKNMIGMLIFISSSKFARFYFAEDKLFCGLMRLKAVFENWSKPLNQMNNVL